MFGPLCDRRTQYISLTRPSAPCPSLADRPCLPRPSFSPAETRRPAGDFIGERPFRTGAEITLPQASKIDFVYGARATEPARAPVSVAPRGCPLSLRCAQRAQDGRAEPPRRTPLWWRQSSGRLRRAAGARARCGWSQPLTLGAISAFSASCARPSAGSLAVEVAQRRSDGRTVGWRCRV